MSEHITRIMENVSKVSLRGGIFGKAALCLITIAICISSIAISSSVTYIKLCAILLISILGVYVLQKMLEFAKYNPTAAILEGADFAAHERLMHAKGTAKLPLQPNTIDHPQPAVEDPNASDSSHDQELGDVE